MGSLLSDVAGGASGGALRGPLMALATLTAPVDVEETDDAFIIELDLPGVRKENVSVDLMGNELLVKGDVQERERSGMLRRQSRRFGAFEHRVTVPGDVDPDSVTATLENGVLTVRLAKARSSQPRHIEIGS
jgi:HSP20 family protein